MICPSLNTRRPNTEFRSMEETGGSGTSWLTGSLTTSCTHPMSGGLFRSLLPLPLSPPTSSYPPLHAAQVPRLYSMFHANRNVRTFSEFLDNLFLPLFEVSADPSTHPKLHLLLRQVVGFDCVDDESKTEVRLPGPDDSTVHPEQWTAGNPHYAYYCYYLYANLHVLNSLRRAQNLSTFCFRPHSGEAGELNHLHAAFLTARGINHGINLRKSPSLQYLYYLTQVVMSCCAEHFRSCLGPCYKVHFL